MHVIYNLAFLLAGWCFGDWRNFNKYYPTILYLMVGDLLYNFLNADKLLWRYHGNIPPNHTLITILIMIVSYSATVLIYLSRFPKTRGKQILWICFWIVLYGGIECINEKIGLISHHYGWNMWWSLLLDVMLFLMLLLHYKKPLLAWGLSVPLTLFWWFLFGVPVEKMK
ncbi:MAG: CBO0543 family protein [Ectobacillus sp.]